MMSKCALCGKEAKGRRNEHLLLERIASSVVKLREEVKAAVEKRVSRPVKPGPMREVTMVPWRLGKTGRPPNVGVVAEVEVAQCTVLGVATPAEGFRRLVPRQSTGAETTGGNWVGDGVVQHKVHNVEGAGAEIGGEEAEAPGSDMEHEEEWGQQAGWGRAIRGIPEGGSRCWTRARRLYPRRQGWRKLESQGGQRPRKLELQQNHMRRDRCCGRGEMDGAGAPMGCASGGSSPAAEIDCSTDAGDGPSAW